VNALIVDIDNDNFNSVKQSIYNCENIAFAYHDLLCVSLSESIKRVLNISDIIQIPQ